MVDFKTALCYLYTNVFCQYVVFNFTIYSFHGNASNFYAVKFTYSFPLHNPGFIPYKERPSLLQDYIYIKIYVFF